MSFFYLRKLSYIALLSGGLAVAQTVATSPARATLGPQTTIPITFSKMLSAKNMKAGDPIEARTLQQIRLLDGDVVGQGAEVLGHIVEAQPFAFDKTPYAKQKQASLTIQFDTLVTKQGKIPLHVSLRAIADRFASNSALTPRPSDEDPLERTTQVGGDIVTPSQNEIVSHDGDTVGYNKRGGNFAHLIANGRCDNSSTEQPISIFSASACGAYGFTGLVVTSSGSQISFTSTRRTPEIPRASSALLESTPDQTATSGAE